MNKGIKGVSCFGCTMLLGGLMSGIGYLVFRDFSLGIITSIGVVGMYIVDAISYNHQNK